VLDDFRDGEGHDGDWTNRHILGGGEELSQRGVRRGKNGGG
jgi:hypothetical protein